MALVDLIDEIKGLRADVALIKDRVNERLDNIELTILNLNERVERLEIGDKKKAPPLSVKSGD